MSGTAITEEEARKKWCPMVRVNDCGAYDPVSVNRQSRSVSATGFDVMPITRCIASGCMMWRTVREHFKATTKERDQHVGWECSPHPNSNYATYHRNDRGYCGLAGEQ